MRSEPERAAGFGTPLFNVLDYWQPGQQVRPWCEAEAEGLPRTALDVDAQQYAEDVRYMKRNMGTAKLVMVALASTSTPTNTVQAVTFQQQDRLAQRAGVSVRQLQRYLERLARLQEIHVVACDGRYCFGRHRKTPHYIINNPPQAPIFDAAKAAARLRSRTQHSQNRNTRRSSRDD